MESQSPNSKKTCGAPGSQGMLAHCVCTGLLGEDLSRDTKIRTSTGIHTWLTVPVRMEFNGSPRILTRCHLRRSYERKFCQATMFHSRSCAPGRSLKD